MAFMQEKKSKITYETTYIYSKCVRFKGKTGNKMSKHEHNSNLNASSSNFGGDRVKPVLSPFTASNCKKQEPPILLLRARTNHHCQFLLHKKPTLTAKGRQFRALQHAQPLHCGHKHAANPNSDSGCYDFVHVYSTTYMHTLRKYMTNIEEKQDTG